MAAALRPESEYPLRLGPNSQLRWIAVSADGKSRVSRSFKFWVRGREAYLCQRSLPDFKISIHAEVGHAAFKDHDISKAWLGEDSKSRYLTEWTSPAEFHPGWREVFEVVHPHRELTEFAELGLEDVELEYLPVPPGKAVHVIVFRNRDAGVSTKVTVPDCIHLAVMKAREWQYNLVAQLRPWGPLELGMP
jgi:hypothetical protein